jgi:uncharacterized iron-regulated membrane protein
LPIIRDAPANGKPARALRVLADIIALGSGAREGRGTYVSQTVATAAPRRSRRLLARVHMWVALALGLYIVVLSVSGSLAVFRREANLWFVARDVPMVGVRTTGDELKAAVAAAYPGAEIVAVRESRRPDRPASVIVERNGKRSDRLFDPYALKDVGDSYPAVLRAMEWLVDLHDNLLAGPEGRTLNGVGGLLVAFLIVTGLIIWWPGKRRAWRSLKVGKPEASRRFAWQLHNALGVWSFLMLLLWALTAVYFGFPEYWEIATDYFDTDKTDTDRPGEAVLLFLIKLHFGRFGPVWVRFLWFALGLLPVVLFVTGFALWWTRVVRRRIAAD